MDTKTLYELSREYSDRLQEVKMRIIERLENHSLDERTKATNLRNPFTLECVLVDPIIQMYHGYDIGQLEATRRALADIEYLIAYEEVNLIDKIYTEDNGEEQ